VNLVSIGGPNMGVTGVPNCDSNSSICKNMNKFISHNLVYNRFV